jgi:hypothetical protein
MTRGGSQNSEHLLAAETRNKISQESADFATCQKHAPVQAAQDMVAQDVSVKRQQGSVTGTISTIDIPGLAAFSRRQGAVGVIAGHPEK